MAITAVGSTASASGTALKTLTLSPTAIGDVLVLAVACANTTSQISAVAGGGVTTWHRLIFANPGASEGDSELWFGGITAAGPATIIITTTAANNIDLFAQQFTLGGPASWTADGSGAASSSTASGFTGNYPSVTPAGAGELYVGCASLSGGSPLGGSSAGFTYANASSNVGQFLYKASPVGAQSPVWSQGTNQFWGACSALLVGALVFTATATAVASASGAAAGVLTYNATATAVATASGLAVPLPPVVDAPTVTAVAGNDPLSGDPIITIAVEVDSAGTRGAFTVAVTLLRNDGEYVLGASPLYPLPCSSMETGTIVDRTAPYGLPATYIASAILIEPGAGTEYSPPSLPSAPVTMGQAPDTTILYGRMGWAKDEDTTGVLYRWLSGIGELIQTIDSLSRDGFDAEGKPAPGWSQVLDINRAPTYVLPWLAQFVGVRVDPNARDDQQRYAIENPSGFGRGSPDYMVAAANQYLLPGYTVVIIERDTSAYHLHVNVPQAGIAGTSTCLSIWQQYPTCAAVEAAFATCEALWFTDAEIIAAINATIPGGLQWTINFV
jgi:hypothetical protein